ncbi:ANTAR domain-containing protein [Streptomyces sp. H10-C2]|uniref:ANTAR domain-containing protein n=1 Tax=unclassified Streptomyces TaxID=2593676 RepID=UPI0024BB1349|nr:MULTISPECIES: ANTAR domain-containing protein [unclassified Streptomyces]MDJ0340384.1 ANTAR domain-containing protein [Streptomyces sp. PH10-H1]MDJ0368168.1 ANTAR domain-containing protein [Streptomyces sp. H10-C2]
MTDSKVTELIRVLVLSGGQGPPPGWTGLCADVLGVDGIAISVAMDGTELLWFSDERSAQLDDLQFTLGEGPSVEATRDGSLNLETNLDRPLGERWPAFIPAAVEAGVLAVFAFPLRLGAICFGGMTGHRRRPGPLGEQAVSDALTIADAMAVHLLTLGPREPGATTGYGGGLAGGYGNVARHGYGNVTGHGYGNVAGPGYWGGFADLHRAEVHQAAGILSVRLDVPLPEALVRLRAHAYTSDRPILDVARASTTVCTCPATRRRHDRRDGRGTVPSGTSTTAERRAVMEREQRLADTFVELADTLIDDFDVIDFLHQLATRCVELLEVSAAAIMLALPGADLQPAAASDQRAELSDLLALNRQEGPALDCYRSGAPVGPFDISRTTPQWPAFAGQAQQAGYGMVCALPLRLRHDVIGSLLLLRTDPTPLSHSEVRLAQALADAATIGILHQQTLRRHAALTAQLHTALHSRIAIEQAKGILAARWETTVDEAFKAMRRHARAERRLLSDVARDVVNGGLQPERVR